MRKRASSRVWGGLCGLLVLSLFYLALGSDRPASQNGRPDWLTISISTASSPDEMPPVWFAHDRHTDALTGQDCTACHTKDPEGRIRFAFKQATGDDYQADMAEFHDNCIGCHTEMAQQGGPAGPRAGECRLCHTPAAPDRSAWTAMRFDHSLHARHEASPRIGPAAETDSANCSACHHRYDPDTQTLYYEKGTEGACQYCHAPVAATTPDNPARAMRQAAHDGCVSCHLTNQTQAAQEANAKFGPITCAGCHDQSLQAQIATVQPLPRFKRNQPDAVLLATRLTSQLAASPDARAAVPAVAFDHRSHEANVASCRTCHHASLQKCSECHTPDGAREGAFVGLGQAMHASGRDPSCIGCHQQAQADPACAGCHSMMPASDFAATGCQACHGVATDDQAAAVLADPAARAAMAAGAVKGRGAGAPAPLPPDADIPEFVTIGTLSDAYEPVRLPHRKIVRALADRIADNTLAKTFHPTSETLCQGCHHNAAALPKPPACASCHGTKAATASDGRPALLGAYHLQCITCHDQMGIEKPAATACTECHPPRRSTASQN